MSVVAVVGLGYVGLPLAVEFGKKITTIGYDLSVEKIEHYRRFCDPTGEVSTDDLKAATQLTVTTDPAALAQADFIIVAVPTPVDEAHIPDFSPLVGSSTSVGKNLKKGAIVVYESHWGSTAAVARAIAEGLGPDARALDTDAATAAVVAEAGLVVAGAPVIAFGLPRAMTTQQLAGDVKAPTPADVSHPLLRAWLDSLPAGPLSAGAASAERGCMAAFETRIWWSPRGATGTIESKLRRAGYRRLAKAKEA